MTRELNFSCLTNTDGQRFLFVWDDAPESRRELLRIVGQMAADSELAFNWFDAASVSRKACEDRAAHQPQDV